MHLKFAHYRNRFCMFRTYYALANGLVQPESFTMSVHEVPDPPSHAQEEALIRGEVDVANLYLPNFLRCKLAGAAIVGIATEWKSTSKGNGLFVLRQGAVQAPGDLTGRVLATHQGAHALHRFLLKHRYGVDERSLRWEAHPQENLIDVLKSAKVDAVVLLDHFFFRGENDPDLRCLYSDGEAFAALFGFREMIKHMVAVRARLLDENPALRDELLQTFRNSFHYGEKRLDEIATQFIARYGGDREALLASARYPKIEFTFTEAERKIIDTQMAMLVEMGELSHAVPLDSAFVG